MTSALAGIRVLDLSRVLAGPWCTQILADLGAEVIKVERPGQGDDTRSWGPPFVKDKDGNPTRDAAYFHSTNRNKKSITVDFHRPEGQKLLRDLAAKSDIVIENYKLGTLKHYGLDYDALKVLHPGLIYCSITAYGQSGPYAPRPGYDFLVQGLGGLMSITGTPESDPAKVGVAFADLSTGLYAAIAILAALHHRRNTGEGQCIDLGLLDVQMAMLANQAMYYLVSGQCPPRIGNAHVSIMPYDVFPASDGFVIVAGGNDSQFRHLLACAGRADLADDPRFAHNADRIANRAILTPILRDIFKTKSKDDWVTALEAANVPCAPVNTIDEAFADPQVRHRGLAIDLPHPAYGHVPGIANPIRLSETPAAYVAASPMPGQHTDSVLRDILGLSDAEIAGFKSGGVV